MGIEPVYYTTFLVHVVFVFGVHEKGFDGVVAFEVHLDAQAVVGLLEPFPTSFCVWDHDGDIIVVGSFIVGVVFWSIVVVCVLWLNLMCRLLRAHDGKLHASRAFPM